MRFIVLFILLAFPVIDLMVTMRFARWTGIPTLVWLLASAAIGTLLLRHERGGFRARTLGALRGDQPLMRGLIDSGRKVLAGMLVILPGLWADLLAVALLHVSARAAHARRRLPPHRLGFPAPGARAGGLADDRLLAAPGARVGPGHQGDTRDDHRQR